MIHILKKKRVSRLIATALLMAGMGVSGAVQAQEEINLLWVQPMKDHPVHRLMQAGFLNKCEELRYKCEVVGDPSATAYDIPATLPLAEAALSRTKFDAVAVYGPDPAIFSYIAKLGNEGFPVVTWHVLPPEGTVPGLKAAAAQEIPDAGTNAALALGEKLGGKGVIALTQGASNDTENAMSDAFRKAIAENYPDITVLPTQMEIEHVFISAQMRCPFIRHRPVCRERHCRGRRFARRGPCVFHLAAKW